MQGHRLTGMSGRGVGWKMGPLPLALIPTKAKIRGVG